MDPGSIIASLVFIAVVMYVPTMIAQRRRRLIRSVSTVMVVEKLEPETKVVYAQGREYDPSVFNPWPFLVGMDQFTIYRLLVHAQSCDNCSNFIVEVDEATYNSAEKYKYIKNPLYRERGTRQEAVA